MPISTTLHFVAIPWITFSHWRQMVALVLNLVHRNPTLVITILSHKLTIQDIVAELGRSSCDESTRSRIRVIGLVQDDPTGPDLAVLLEAHSALGKAFREAYQVLLGNGDLVCTSSHKSWEQRTLPTPSLVLYDMFIPHVGQIVKQFTPSTNCLLLFPSTVGSFIRHYGPRELGGLGSLEAEARAEMAEGTASERMSLDEVASRIALRTCGEAFPNSDGVRLYDYELNPQEVHQSPEVTGRLMESARQALKYADGAVLTTVTNFEPLGAAEARLWYEELPKKLFLVGPRFIPGEFSPIVSKQPMALNPIPPIFAFLNRQKPRSVCVISFGTIYYPYHRPSYVKTLFEVLLERQIPFVFSRISIGFEPESLPTALEQRMKATGLGFVVDEWFPQREVLVHPSIIAFVTTGAASSMWECILAGVVGVYWPFTGDQPLHAAHLSTKLDCAFELVQVRTGVGAQPPHRGGKVDGTDEAVEREIRQIIDDLSEEVGIRKRNNLERVRQQIFGELDKGGDSYTAMEELLAFGTPHLAQ